MIFSEFGGGGGGEAALITFLKNSKKYYIVFWGAVNCVFADFRFSRGGAGTQPKRRDECLAEYCMGNRKKNKGQDNSVSIVTG